MKNIIIISAGKFGREVLSWAEDAIKAGANWKVKGFLDDRTEALSGFDLSTRILAAPADYQPAKDDIFLPALGDPVSKYQYCRALMDRGAEFGTLIHPRAYVGPRVKIGKGVVLAPMSTVTCDVTIGNFVTLGVMSALAHDSNVGDWCQICGHCGINGNAILEEGVFLGSHACILPKARVGAWSFVGANSMVIKSVPPRTKVFGTPAVTIGKIENSPR
jgi:sugar O-acyltransferase (sialic acid O-acetyltransferase NeuD family)